MKQQKRTTNVDLGKEKIRKSWASAADLRI